MARLPMHDHRSRAILVVGPARTPELSPTHHLTVGLLPCLPPMRGARSSICASVSRCGLASCLPSPADVALAHDDRDESQRRDTGTEDGMTWLLWVVSSCLWRRRSRMILVP